MTNFFGRSHMNNELGILEVVVATFSVVLLAIGIGLFNAL